MANDRVGNTIYITTTGVVTTDRNTRVIGIFFTPDSANDQIILRETASSGIKLHLHGATAKQTDFYRMVDMPIIFGNGIYVDTLTSSAVATLIVSQSNGE